MIEHTHKDITSLSLRSMMAGDLLATKKLRCLPEETRYWMRVQVSATYNRLQWQVNAGNFHCDQRETRMA